MKRNIVLTFLGIILGLNFGFSQELQAEVVINTQQINQTNQQVFKTLQNALQEFINTTHWTEKEVQPNERIECHFVFTINSYESGRFSADLQIQASRPVYNSAYVSPLFNYKDDMVHFSYQEYEPLTYNPNTFTSNLTSIVAFYVNIIIGLDADSFVLSGGDPYFRKAQNIVSQAQSSSYEGWRQGPGRSRWQLIEDLLSMKYKDFHQVYYDYHRQGLDLMAEQPKAAKQKIANALIKFSSISENNLNSFLIQAFFDTKAEEIVKLFSGGAYIDTVKLREQLNTIMPSKSKEWSEIK